MKKEIVKKSKKKLFYKIQKNREKKNHSKQSTDLIPHLL